MPEIPDVDITTLFRKIHDKLFMHNLTLDVLPSVNEGDSMGFNKPWAVLPHGFLQVPAADR
jgi:hypothetical protein